MGWATRPVLLIRCQVAQRNTLFATVEFIRHILMNTIVLSGNMGRKIAMNFVQDELAFRAVGDA